MELKRTLFTLAAAVLLAVMANSAGIAAEPQPLRVMSFNIRYDNPGDGENAWPHRKDMAAGMIRFHRADTAGLQEALRGQVDDLAERLHYIHNAVGAVPAPWDCFLLLRSTKTLHVRMERHCSNARRIAQTPRSSRPAAAEASA